jgi:Tfp pilus assembly protein PilX
MSGALPFMHRGVALVVALVILAVVSLLALSAMQRASTELLMAGSEQYRLAAAAAASAGIEQGIAQLAAARALPAAPAAGPTAFGSSGASLRFTIRPRGELRILPGSSAEKFLAMDYEIESSATAPRGAADTQLQGVRVLQSLSGAASPHHRLASGL